jgi:hypothetical protein
MAKAGFSVTVYTQTSDEASSANSGGVEPASRFLQAVQFYRVFHLRLSGFHPVRSDHFQKPVSSFRMAAIRSRQRREVIAQR